MEPITYIQKHKILVDQAIDRVFMTELHDNTSQASQTVLTKLHTFVKRGKHIRSGLFLISLEMFDVTPTSIHFDVGAALEIMHSAFLIHDDIMDNDDMRRGEPSIHASYRKLTKYVNHSSDAYANAMGLGAGDIAIFIAYKLLLEATESLPNHTALLTYGINEYLRVGFAQMQDVENSYKTDEPIPEEIKRLYIQKTARYTFSLPFIVGAYVAHAPDTIINSLNELGEHIGLLYQLRDDEIGLFNSSLVTGKPVGSDIRENKKTMIHALLIHACDNQETAFIERLRHKKTLTNSDMDKLRKLLEKYGVEENLAVMKKESKRKGLDLIKHLPVQKRYADFLRGLIDYIESRNN